MCGSGPEPTSPRLYYRETNKTSAMKGGQWDDDGVNTGTLRQVDEAKAVPDATQLQMERGTKV